MQMCDWCNLCFCCSDTGKDLLSMLQQLQSRFTWELKKEDLKLDDLSKQLQHDIDVELGEPGTVAHYYRFLAYVRYLQGWPKKAETLLSQSEQKTIECYGEDSELRLIVTYGDLAWLKYHRGLYTQSQSYYKRVQDILVKYPVDSSTDLHPEVYGEKAWTYLKLSKSYYSKAIDCFRRALELQPDKYEWNKGYAIALYRTEEVLSISQQTQTITEESPATKQLRLALEINPDDAILLSMLALMLLYYQKPQEAEGLVERALEIGPDDSQVIRYVAKYLRKQDHLDTSIRLLKTILEKNSQSAFIHHQLALCYKEKKDKLLKLRPKPEREVQHWRRLCISHLEEALRLKSTLNHTKAMLVLGYAEEYDIGRAREMFTEVLEKVEQEPDNIRQFIYRCCAEFCHYHILQRDRAVTYYTKGLQISATTSEGKRCMRKLELIAGQRLQDNHRDAAAHGILGAVAKAKGELKRAVENYENALENDTNNDGYLSALGELLQELKLYDDHRGS
ncbi:interferon-induced protein with tetratricopeptide repeats 1B-like isoform X2 [Anabas testudineus]|uniref:interferon-induced protein with tetratricopeptide repeats 1B-like isoform X2 n=1 Tax=Anabas testudineus TaxID=64144 RepID=UPI000E4593BC|nr:interferon-induced protein with tetratricopeptide repeats 1B-like isoform X2 [Anabas testudineus]